MNQNNLRTSIFASLLLLMAFSSLAQAQLLQTWVSGVGNDANLCDRTAPCRTFSGALAKTVAGGEISVVDSGSFGPVTITKAVTISGTGQLASILPVGTNGVVVSAGPDDVVILRDLSISGAGGGTNGIRFLGGAALHIQGCDIYGFNAGTALGIDFEPAGVSRLFVEDTTLRNNGVFSTNVGGGILLKPSLGGGGSASMRNVTVDRNVTGIQVGNEAALFIQDSVISGNRQNGLFVESTGGMKANAFLNHVSVVSSQESGLVSSGSAAMMRIGDTSVSGNFINGLQAISMGQILSFGSNNIAGNLVDGAPTGFIVRQ
jgi:Right handed beta helix region